MKIRIKFESLKKFKKIGQVAVIRIKFAYIEKSSSSSWLLILALIELNFALIVSMKSPRSSISTN